MSNLVHKVKDALSSDKKHETPEGTHGHHDSRAANAADPRIDSDRDHRANPAGVNTTTHGTTGTSGLTGSHGTTGTSGLTGTHGTHGTTGSGLTGSHGTHTGTTGTSGLTGTHGTSGVHNTTGTAGGLGGVDPNRGPGGPAPGTDGPHSSNLLNKADPRVDSDRDHSHNLGANPHGTATTGSGAPGSGFSSGTHGTTGSGLTGSHGTHGTTGSGLTGSHGTTGSGLPGTHGTHNTTGTSGLTGTHGTHGTTGSGLTGSHGTTGSGLTGSHGTHGTTGSGLTGSHGTTGSGVPGTHGTHNTTGNTFGSGPGPADNTAGPHKSDLLNKVDPRVDSDRDGSKTVGQDKTYAQSNVHAHKDPTDAAQVPPSVLRKSIGEPEIAHDDHRHDRAARHSVSHQEEHRGL